MNKTPQKERRLSARRITFSSSSSRDFEPDDGRDVLSGLVPQTPENTSDEFSSESSTDSFLESTDSQIICTKEMEESAKLNYRKNLDEFKFSLKKICRQLKMIYRVDFQFNKNADPFTPSKIETDLIKKQLKQLGVMERTIERRTSYVIPHFSILFQLHRFIEHCPFYLLSENLDLLQKICDVIETWIKNPAFHHQNYDKLLFFLRGFYEDQSLHSLKSYDEPTLNEILNYWQYSYYFDSEVFNDKILKKKSCVEAFYFQILLDKFDEKLAQCVYPIPSLLDLGNQDIDFFHQFLTEFSIPFAGPFRSKSQCEKRIIYFLSSADPADHIVNKNIPIYGCYGFQLSSIKDTSTESAALMWEDLEEVPFWLTYFPPLFNFSLENIREQLSAVTL